MIVEISFLFQKTKLMKSLIFGALGQDGKFLSDELLRNGNEVIGFVRSGAETKVPIGIEGVTYIAGNLLDRSFVEQTIDKCDPDYIYNLASFSSVKNSFDFPDLSEQINFIFVESNYHLQWRTRILAG